MLLLQLLKIFLPRGQVLFGLYHLLGLMVKDYENAVSRMTGLAISILTDEVSILEVEAIQLVTSLLSVHDIFIDNEGRSFGLVGGALTYLTREQLVSRSSKDSSHSSYRMGPNFPKRSNSSSGETL